jgi:hypothetical protein
LACNAVLSTGGSFRGEEAALFFRRPISQSMLGAVSYLLILIFESLERDLTKVGLH